MSDLRTRAELLRELESWATSPTYKDKTIGRMCVSAKAEIENLDNTEAALSEALAALETFDPAAVQRILAGRSDTNE